MNVTNRHTDRSRYSVCSNWPNLSVAAMRPNNSEQGWQIFAVTILNYGLNPPGRNRFLPVFTNTYLVQQVQCHKMKMFLWENQFRRRERKADLSWKL